MIFKDMKKLILTAGLFVFGLASYAQFGSWGDWEDSSGDKKKEEKKKDDKKPGAKSDVASDTMVADDGWGSSDDGGWGSSEGWGDAGTGGTGYLKPVAAKKDFKREGKVLLPYDSLRKLIIYTGIQELEDCEFCTEDSLYYRFKDWAQNNFGPKIFKSKKTLGLDEQFQKINLILTLPFSVKNTKFTSSRAGNVQLNLTMWFQPYRYKYLFSNFVHEVPPTGTQTESQMVYFEYYQESKRNIDENNGYLNAIDNQVKEYIDKLKVALNDKPISLIDDDDW
jgi:hypothetical protein